MADPHDPSTQTTALNWAAEIIIGLASVIYTISAWVVVHFIKKVDKIEESNRKYALREEVAKEVASLELRMAEVVSRRELAAAMMTLSEDRQRMHEENIDHLNRMGDDVSEGRADIRSVHKRIDELLVRK